MHEMRVRSMLENIKKEKFKTLQNACAKTHLDLKMNKIQ